MMQVCTSYKHLVIGPLNVKLLIKAMLVLAAMCKLLDY